MTFFAFAMLMVVWLLLAAFSALGICAICALFGNRQPAQPISPTVTTVTLRPAVSERPMPSDGVLHHAQRLAHA